MKMQCNENQKCIHDHEQCDLLNEPCPWRMFDREQFGCWKYETLVDGKLVTRHDVMAVINI